MSGDMIVYMNMLNNKLTLVTSYIRQKSRVKFNKCSCIYKLIERYSIDYLMTSLLEFCNLESVYIGFACYPIHLISQ